MNPKGNRWHFNPHDIVGRKFGKLTVVRRMYERRAGGNRQKVYQYYECLCDCGEAKIVRRDGLLRGTTRSCGCLRKFILPPGQALINQRFCNYSTWARRRDYEFSLTREQFGRIVILDCHYCGASPSIHLKRPGIYRGEVRINGIDRVDNNLGYTLDNIVPCCKRCNKMKQTYTETEFKAGAASIVRHQVLARENLLRFLKTGVVILLLTFSLTACKTKIEVLPVSDEERPLRILENGNWEVSPGYVQYHVQLMAKVKVLEAELRELRK